MPLQTFVFRSVKLQPKLRFNWRGILLNRRKTDVLISQITLEITRIKKVPRQGSQSDNLVIKIVSRLPGKFGICMRVFQEVWNRVTGSHDGEGDPGCAVNVGPKFSVSKTRQEDGMADAVLRKTVPVAAVLWDAADISCPWSPLFAPSSFPRIIGPFSSRFILFSFRLHAKRSAARPTILFINELP